MEHGFMKVCAVAPVLKPTVCSFNAKNIINASKKASQKGAQIILFPELCLTGYTCGDFFLKNTLLENAQKELQTILKETKKLNIVLILGLPLTLKDKILNVATIIYGGKILGIVPKTYLPNYHEFYEKRWFSPAGEIKEKEIELFGTKIPLGTNLLFKVQNTTFAVEICEDLWAPLPPSTFAALNGAEIIFNLSASNELTGKNDYRKSLIAQQSARLNAGYVYVSSAFGESSTDTVYSANAFIYENGSLLKEAPRLTLKEQMICADIDVERLKNLRQQSNTFRECATQFNISYVTIDIPIKNNKGFFLTRNVPQNPFLPSFFEERAEEILNIQALALAKRLTHINANKVILGLSGGLDSTLALLVCVNTFKKLNYPLKNILALTLPGLGTTKRTKNNAEILAKLLGVSFKEIDIKPAVLQHFKDIGQNPKIFDITFENTQARERTQILMDLANKTNAILVGTGDMSELALGWATFGGDHISMYGLNAGVPKTLIKYIIACYAKKSNIKIANVLKDILKTPISPELTPAQNGKIKQKTEDIIGPYILHDFFLYYFLRFGFGPKKIYFLACYAFENTYSKKEIKKFLKVFFKRFITQQFKRSCLPDGPKIGSVSLSPRADLRLPSDVCPDIWLEEVDGL